MTAIPATPHQPMYARLLKLRNLSPSGFLCFAFLEGSIALAILLALAELVSWWGVLVLPASVAGMVKLNDAIAGLVTRAPTSAAAARRAGRVDALSHAPDQRKAPSGAAASPLPLRDSSRRDDAQSTVISSGGSDDSRRPWGAGRRTAAAPGEGGHRKERSRVRVYTGEDEQIDLGAPVGAPLGPVEVGELVEDRPIGASSTPSDFDRQVGALGLAGVGGLAGSKGLLGGADRYDEPPVTPPGRRRGRQTRATIPNFGEPGQTAITRGPTARAIGSTPEPAEPETEPGQPSTRRPRRPRPTGETPRHARNPSDLPVREAWPSGGDARTPAGNGPSAVGRRPSRPPRSGRRPEELSPSSAAAEEALGNARTVDLRHPERTTNTAAAAADTGTLNGPRAPEDLDTRHQRERQSGARRYE